MNLAGVARTSGAALRAFALGVLLVGSPGLGRAQLSGLKDAALSTPGSIEGTLHVPPASGRTTEGVVVLIYETGALAIVGADGGYRFEAVPPGAYTLIATGEGFSRLKITDVVVKPARRVVLQDEEIPIILRDGEVQLLETYFVSASKDIETLNRFDVTDRRPEPFATANVDLPRTRDDAQPYYLFDAKTIEQSGSTNTEEFIRSRLPMNLTKQSLTRVVPTGTGGGAADNKSVINFGGFGPTNTLILVNGRRLPPVPVLGLQGSPAQPDVNGLPLAAIERIEILPASASAIYGGDAVGGVVNIVLRHDFSGTEVALGYENLYHSDAPVRTASLTSGQNFEGGRTNLLFTLSRTEADPLRYADRAAEIDRYRARAWANNPAAAEIPSYAASPLGATANITAAPSYRVENGQAVLVPGELFGPGSPDHTFVPAGYAGGGGLLALRANAGKYNLEPPAIAVGSAPFYGATFPLAKQARVTAATLNLRRQMSPRLEAFVELGWSQNRSDLLNAPGAITVDLPAAAPTNVFGTDVRVTAPLATGLGGSTEWLASERAVAGLKAKLPGDWVGEGDVAIDHVGLRYQSGLLDLWGVQQAFARGELDLLRDLVVHPVSLDGYRGRLDGHQASSITTADVRAAGPLGRLPGGAIAASVGTGWRRDLLNDGAEVQTRPGSSYGDRQVQDLPGLAQQSMHGDGELQLPFVSAANGHTGLRELDLQLAGRLDRFALGDLAPHGTAARYTAMNYVAGLRYRPAAGFLLRASLSSAFRPPTFDEIKPMVPPLAGLTPTGWFPALVSDPRRGGEIATQAAASIGGNADIRPERARQASTGVVLEPAGVPGLRLAVDRVQIERYHAIYALTAQAIVDEEAAFPGRVVRGPVAAGDPFGVGAITFIDGTAMNVAESRSVSYAISVDYLWRSARAGTWQWFGLANSWQHFQTRHEPGEPLTEQLNATEATALQQPKFSSSSGVNWSRGPWSAGWSTRYFGAYRVVAAARRAQGTDHVAEQFYHDVYLAYAFPAASGGATRRARILSGVSVQVGAKNVFDTAPAFEAGNVGMYYSDFGDIRGGSWYVTLRKKF